MLLPQGKNAVFLAHSKPQYPIKYSFSFVNFNNGNSLLVCSNNTTTINNPQHMTPVTPVYPRKVN